MTSDDIIRMAREAELPTCHTTHPKALKRFAELVAAAERDECAKMCEDAIGTISDAAIIGDERREVGINVCTNLAANIRARGSK